MGRTFKRYLKSISILTLINLVAAGAICFFIHKKSFQAYSTMLFWTSGVIMAIGAFSVVGSITGRNSMGYQKARTIGTQDQMQRIKEDLDMTEKGLKFVVIAGITGIVGFLISSLILKF